MSRRTRLTQTNREVSAGCQRCGGGNPQWNGNNAQGLAAQHHDRTGHETWVRVVMHIRYGVGKQAQANEPRLI